MSWGECKVTLSISTHKILDNDLHINIHKLGTYRFKEEVTDANLPSIPIIFSDYFIWMTPRKIVEVVIF